MDHGSYAVNGLDWDRLFTGWQLKQFSQEKLLAFQSAYLKPYVWYLFYYPGHQIQT